MFGHRYFGSRHFGPRYFGDGGVGVVAPPVSTGQSFSRRRLRRERLRVEVELVARFSAEVEATIRMREFIDLIAETDFAASQRMRNRTKADLAIDVETSGGDSVMTEYNELEELAILGLL